jgi:hypothetical protein
VPGCHYGIRATSPNHESMDPRRGEGKPSQSWWGEVEDGDGGYSNDQIHFPFSEICFIGYNKAIKGFPSITFEVISLTKIKVVLIQTPSLQT